MSNDSDLNGADSVDGIPCLVCNGPLTVRLARGRKSGKPFVMLVCGQDGRHFRAFVSDRGYVRGVIDRVEGRDG